jgi:hypothetical protein
MESWSTFTERIGVACIIFLMLICQKLGILPIGFPYDFLTGLLVFLWISIFVQSGLAILFKNKKEVKWKRKSNQKKH